MDRPYFDKDMELRAEFAFVRNCVDLTLLSRGHGQIAVADGFTMRTVPDGEMLDAQPISLTRESAALLMDDLWRAGIRPTEYVNQDSTVRHLEDMRSLVGMLLEHEMP